MHIDTTVTGTCIVALAIVAHAWHGRMQGNPRVLSAIGWVVNILVMLALATCWLRH
jgi:hypothetical protein